MHGPGTSSQYQAVVERERGKHEPNRFDVVQLGNRFVQPRRNLAAPRGTGGTIRLTAQSGHLFPQVVEFLPEPRHPKVLSRSRVVSLEITSMPAGQAAR